MYNNGYNVKAGAIVAIENASPEYCAAQVENPPTGAALAALVPDINRWSDVVFGIWADTAGKVMSHGLNYIFRDNVVNEDTKHIMDVVMGQGNDVATGNLHATYPGREFSTDTWQGRWISEDTLPLFESSKSLHDILEVSPLMTYFILLL